MWPHRALIVILLSLTFVIEASCQTISQREVQRALNGLIWIETGGSRTPLGEITNTSFTKMGVEIEPAGNGYRTKQPTRRFFGDNQRYSALMISCYNARLQIIIVGYRIRSGVGKILIDGQPNIFPIEFESDYISNGPVSMANLTHFRGTLRNSSRLIMEVLLNSGVRYWRFDLSGLEVQESLCP